MRDRIIFVDAHSSVLRFARTPCPRTPPYPPRYAALIRSFSSRFAPVSASTTRPVSSTYPRSATCSALCAFCSTRNTVTPSARIVRMMSKICAITSGARPSVGSSSSSRRGRLISARPIASICCSPPDIVPARCAERSLSRGNSRYTCSTPSSISWRFAKKPPIFRFSSTVRLGNTRRPSGEIASPRRMISCVGIAVISSPSNNTRPLDARGVPHTVIISVVLPAPLLPISVTISPFFTSIDTPDSASIAP
ncbi:conserved hypothetical protein [Burkholderia pseudomallei S13]|nr:conserved hypothetical protein [Burkholderia pseudomallei S13]